ncbi:hypothetical protein [Halorhabdus amylolytica]|nr:hypothetical protein [Halorhabdus amylolytica]
MDFYRRDGLVLYSLTSSGGATRDNLVVVGIVNRSLAELNLADNEPKPSR